MFWGEGWTITTQEPQAFKVYFSKLFYKHKDGNWCMTISLPPEEKARNLHNSMTTPPNYKNLQTKTEETKPQSQNHPPFSLKSNIFNVYDYMSI